MPLTNRFIAGVLLGTLAAGTLGAEQHRLEIEPYIWGHNVTGQFGVRNLPPADISWHGSDISAGFSGRAAYLDPAGWGFLVSGYQSRGNWSGTSRFPEFPGGLVDMSMGRLLLAPAWQLPPTSHTQTRLWAGAQMSLLSMDVRLTRADFSYVSAEDSRTWWDPVIGAEVRHHLNETWFVHGSGALGGFGASSRLTAGLLGAVGYQFDPLFSLKLGYRWEMNDYANDGLLADALHQGVLLGIEFDL